MTSHRPFTPARTCPEKMARLTAALEEQFAESARLEEETRENFARLGYGV